MESLKTQPTSSPEFDEFAEDYDTALDRGLKLSGEGKDYFAEGRMKWLKHLLNERGVAPETALDFGCGTGSATPFFFEHLELQSLRGIDPSEKSLENARESWAESFAVEFASTENTEAIEPTFDLAFCNGVFHHIPIAERDGAVGTVRDHLKPGALFAFWENNPWNPVTRYAMSRVPFDRDAIMLWPHEARKLIERNGLKVVLTDYVFFFPAFLAGMRGLEPLLRKVPFGGQYLILAQKPEA